MNSNGKHGFNKSILTIISKHFERIVQSKFKEPRDLNTEDLEISDEQDLEKSDITKESSVHYLENPVGNINTEMNTSYNIEDIYKLNIDNTMVYGLQNSLSNEKSLFNIPTHIVSIDNMIDIEEQEEEPMGLKNNTITNTITIPTIPTIPSVKNEKHFGFGFGYGYNKNYDNNKPYDNAKKCNDIETLLSRVPMSSDIKLKKTKKDIAIE